MSYGGRATNTELERWGSVRIDHHTTTTETRGYLSRIGTPSSLREIATTTKATKLTGRATDPIAISNRKLNAMGPPSPWTLPPERPKMITLKTQVKNERHVRANQR